MQFVRQNPFTSLILGGMGVFGVRYVNNKITLSGDRKEAIGRAKGMNTYVSPIATLPKYHVIVNKNSGSGSVKELFEDEVAPIFHLGGLDFDVSHSKSSSHLQDLVKNTDFNEYEGIVVVGGSGSAQETVTALLNRDDAAVVAKKPIGIIPVGHSNSLMAPFFPENTRRETAVRQAALGILEGRVGVCDAVKIQFDDDKTPIYGLNHYGWGVFGIAAGNGQERRWPGDNRYDFAAYQGTFKSQYSPKCLFDLGYRLPNGTWVEKHDVETTGLIVTTLAHWNMPGHIIDPQRCRNDGQLTLCFSSPENTSRDIVEAIRKGPFCDLNGVETVRGVSEVIVDIKMPAEDQYQYTTKVATKKRSTSEDNAADDKPHSKAIEVEADGTIRVNGKAHGEGSDPETDSTSRTGTAPKEETKEAAKEGSETVEVPVRAHGVYTSVDSSPYYSRPAHISIVPGAVNFFLPSPLPEPEG